jgi:hypothetical protein
MTTNPNSALYWYPKLRDADLDVSVPQTELVEYDFMESFGLLEGDVPDALPWGEFVATVEAIGYPAFVRTDQKSAKHAGPGAYKAEEPDDIPTICAVLTDHHVKANRKPAALMVREWVDINARFRAFDGLPIGREYRVFATPEAELCEHFYWPEKAIEEGRGQPTALDGSDLPGSMWREELGALDSLDTADRRRLREAAITAAAALAGGDVDDGAAWSVDFAQDTSGEWWLLDAALAADSWHPECDQQAVLEVNA